MIEASDVTEGFWRIGSLTGVPVDETMSEDIISSIKNEMESGGSWPYSFDGHQLEQNPFAETWPDNRLFAGHEDELRQLQKNIQRNVNTFVTGPFGTGKTILTRVMYDILAGIEGYHPVFIHVQKGRFTKTMAKNILRELDVEFDSQASQSELYDQIMGTMKTLYEDDIRTVIFYDEVIAGSDGTLRQILHLQRDIDDWEPVLVFNGTTHMLDRIHAKIEPLADRIGDEIKLVGLDPQSTVDLVNKRLRFYCKHSEWRDGQGCGHNEGQVTPFTRESVELVHQDITPYPRHLCREFNSILEQAAEDDRAKIDFEYTESLLEQSAARKVAAISDDETKEILDYLASEGAGSINAISEELNMSSYPVEEHLDTLEKDGLVRATKAGRGIRYKLSELARKELVSQRKA